MIKNVELAYSKDRSPIQPNQTPHVWHSWNAELLAARITYCGGRIPSMVMSVRRMSLGAGYRYLMSSVARAYLDHEATGLTKYYAESGTPPGRFLGAGLTDLADGLGVEPGSIVSEEALFRMLGMLQDPATGKQLGRTPSKTAVAGFDLTFSATWFGSLCHSSTLSFSLLMRGRIAIEPDVCH